MCVEHVYLRSLVFVLNYIYLNSDSSHCTVTLSSLSLSKHCCIILWKLLHDFFGIHSRITQCGSEQFSNFHRHHQSCKCDKDNISCAQKKRLFTKCLTEDIGEKVKQRGQMRCRHSSEWPRCELAPCGVFCPSSLTQGKRNVCCPQSALHASLLPCTAVCVHQLAEWLPSTITTHAHTHICRATDISYYMIFHTLTVVVIVGGTFMIYTHVQ